jgi:YD repeat-containing protein
MSGNRFIISLLLVIQLIVQPLIACQKYTYNALGSLTSVTDADAKTWKFEYDDAQNLRFAKDALQAADGSRVTEYQYDALNRLAKTIQPQNRVTTYGYDSDSNLISTTDPKSQTATMNYDELDRLDDATYTSAASGQQLYHDYKYDAEDNLGYSRDTSKNRT